MNMFLELKEDNFNKRKFDIELKFSEKNSN